MAAPLSMAQQEDEAVSVPAVCRRVTTDLKDVQDILKSVVSSSGGFVSRHRSISEEEEHSNNMEVLDVKPPPLILRQETRPVPDSPPLILEREDTPPSPEVHGETDVGSHGENAAADVGHRNRHTKRHAPIYGEIIILGTNGSLPCTPLNPKMSHSFVLKKQPKATGVSQIVRNPGDAESLSRVSTHTVAMTLAKSKTCVMEFGPDHSMDMFQIGRSTDSVIDLVVVDMLDSPDGKKMFNSSSSVSRYACRILCEREPPYTARVYAAAFDTQRKIQLSAAAPTWVDHETGDTDGLTTNGITILRPEGVFESGVDPGKWREVTIMGNIRERRPLRSSREPGAMIPADTNVLTDGCLIDLCGITLMWRSAMGLDHGPSNTLIRDRQQALNIMTPQCPVNFLTLHFKSGRLITTAAPPDNDELREPWVYMKCGHIFGQHNWKGSVNETNQSRTCPVCSKIGPYRRLELGNERAFFVDEGSLTHAFSPCGHVTTEQTAKYWSKVHVPHLATSWISRCPFCSTELNSDSPYIKLYFN